MAEELYQIVCNDTCGFMVRSHDEEEVVEFARQHVTKAHPEKLISLQELKEAVVKTNIAH